MEQTTDTEVAEVEAEYTLETPVRCSECHEQLQAVERNRYAVAGIVWDFAAFLGVFTWAPRQ